jgi:peptidyl-tRNA hydrolase (EC 3.1.1.29)|nr:MAG: peptidyl-tRNA hydrolase [Candidatus Nanosalinarum sp. J07AB56]
MSQGKMAAQVAHASLSAYRKASKKQTTEWREVGEKKVVLRSPENGLEPLRREAERADLPHHLVKDAGMTELEPGTETALGIGPAKAAEIDTVTGELNTLQ